jgi:tetratricopeptide (TPR) repeat protein
MTVATEGETDSKLRAAALSAQQLQQVLEFLAAAPDEVAAWAEGQAEALRAELDAREAPSVEIPASAGMTVGGAGTSFGHAGSFLGHPGEGRDLDDESDDFYAGLEDDDDVLHRKRRAAGSPKAGGPSASPGGRVFTLRFALVVALLAGILGGVWYAVRPTGAASPQASTPTLGTGTGITAPSDAEVAARIAELEARVAAEGSDVDARLELGVLYFNQRQVDAARDQWLAVTELAPDNATAWYNLGFLYLTIEPADMAAAKAAWQRVIDIDPASEMAKTASMHLAGLQDPAVPDPATPAPTPTVDR